jgi:hypothetical protein
MTNICDLKKLTLVGLLGLATLFPFQIHAQIIMTQFFGDLTCGKYVEAIEKNSFHPYDHYLSGFLTGTNYLRSRLSPNDMAAYRIWLKTYCLQNPFDSFLDALIRLDYSLGEGQKNLAGNPAKKNDAKK